MSDHDQDDRRVQVTADDVIALSSGEGDDALVDRGGEKYWRKLPAGEIPPGRWMGDQYVVLTRADLNRFSDPDDWTGDGVDRRLVRAVAEEIAEHTNASVRHE